MSITDVTLNGVALSDALDDHAFTTDINRPLSGKVRSEFVEVPGRDGAWTFDEEPGDIIITIGVHIWSDTVEERRAAVAALRAWCITPDGRAPLIIGDETDRYWDAKLESAPPSVDEVIDGEAVLIYSCRPYAFSTTESTEAINASGSPDSGSFVEVLDFNAEPLIEITPTNGTITSLTFTLNDAEIAWQVGDEGPNTIAQDETITISSLSDTVTLAASVDEFLTGAFNPSDVDMARVAINGFPEIVNGTNNWALSWTGTATTVDIDIAWRERFI